MTPFNPDNKEKPTYGDLLEPAMHITDQADADQYKEAYIRFIKAHIISDAIKEGKTTEEIDLNSRAYSQRAEEVANSNLGYFAGYYDDAIRERVERLFHCSHPVFGAIKDGSPTPAEAFKMGMEFGKKK
ncbi:MAG: hypothetical protein WC341_10020 [Bacteroidales bacterium]|jgi:hypothetical protein